jgi:hypothetical protein
MPGVLSSAPCDCEYAERARKEFEQEMADLRNRICEAKKLLMMEVS